MNIKRILLAIFSILIIFSLTACKDDKKSYTIQQGSFNEETDKNVSDKVTTSVAAFADTFGTSEPTESAENSTSANLSISSFDDPADWSTEQIVEVYKNAAKKSNSAAKSKSSIELKSISVNNGEHEGLFEFITPIMSKLLANNSDEKNGITGGYNNLAAADVASAKAYKIGNNIAIEMVMMEQVSGARDDALAGSVGHAITAVGDISVVTQQLKDLGLPLEISEKYTKIYYTNPTVKVLLNSNGEIINGTWSYTVDINLNNYKAFGKTVDTTSVIMNNTITVNGGFKK